MATGKFSQGGSRLLKNRPDFAPFSEIPLFDQNLGKKCQNQTKSLAKSVPKPLLGGGRLTALETHHPKNRPDFGTFHSRPKT